MKAMNYLSRLLYALMLCVGMLIVGCNEEPAHIAVTTVTLDTGVLELAEGESATLTATVNPDNATNKGISWTTSDDSIASVNDGVVTAVKLGSAVITVTSDDGGCTATCEVTVRSDLSSSSSANCYIVSQSGTYSFKTVKGNSSDSVGEVSSVEVLWESFGTDETPSIGDLVNNITYKDGCITFKATDRKGNAVIAAKDAGGKILWSWHIWLTDEPQVQEYKNNAGFMMDRNLGATSATPGDEGALGLLYQWGRKDPFLGSSSISSSQDAKSTITWPSAVESTSSTGTIDYVTANPTTFVTDNSNNLDWYYTGSSSADNTRWQSSKTIYDPCPAGWRVPDGGSSGVWSTALGSSSWFKDEELYNSTNKGINFSGKFGSASTIWYPASGYRNSYVGGLSGVDLSGSYWSVAPYSSSAYILYFNYGGRVSPSLDDSRACGFAVRCLQVID